MNHMLCPMMETEDYYTHIVDKTPICHSSWIALRRTNDDMLLPQYYKEYCNQIARNEKLCHIPEEVLRQWLYPFNSKQSVNSVLQEVIYL